MLGNIAVWITEEWVGVKLPHLPVKYVAAVTLILYQPLFNYIFVCFVKALGRVEEERAEGLLGVQIVVKQDVVKYDPGQPTIDTSRIYEAIPKPTFRQVVFAGDLFNSSQLPTRTAPGSSGFGAVPH